MALKLEVTSNINNAPQDSPEQTFIAAVGGKTKKIVLDNSKGKTPKSVVVKMIHDGGGPATFVENYLPANELGIADISSLGIAVKSFEVSWRKVGESHWHTSGLSAAPGSSFHVIGIRWDEWDHATLIAH